MIKYQNGNCSVSLDLSTGTKTRSWEGEPRPEFPESIDLKITDYCDQACIFCHESSTVRGKHASIKNILSAVEGLPCGVEIAVGGGNPMSHPEIGKILFELKRRHLVPNITVHSQQVLDNFKTLKMFQEQTLVYGIGISCEEEGIPKVAFEKFKKLGPNVVFHVIAGIADPRNVVKYSNYLNKILVLGYKQFGFGLKHFSPKVQNNLDQWKYWIGTVIRTVPHVFFDNLALEQLAVKGVLNPILWDKHFMGEDGKYTMYVDAVKNEYAVSSISERRSLENRTARDVFKLL